MGHIAKTFTAGEEILPTQSVKPGVVLSLATDETVLHSCKKVNDCLKL
jgi:hypothetical protein